LTTGTTGTTGTTAVVTTGTTNLVTTGTTGTTTTGATGILQEKEVKWKKKNGMEGRKNLTKDHTR
jgi:hypothetical protein